MTIKLADQELLCYIDQDIYTDLYVQKNEVSTH